MAPDMWTTLLKSAGMLCVVLGVLFTLVYLIKRFSLGGNVGVAQKIVKIISTTHLGTKEKLVLIDLLGSKILLGVTESNINLLTKLDKDVVIDSGLLPKDTVGAGKNIFSSMLKKTVKGFDKK